MINKYFEAHTLDDLMHGVLDKLLSIEDTVNPSRGEMTEILGATLYLHNPRARLSRSESKGKIFSALGELLWYLSGENKLEFIEYYIPEVYNKESDDGINIRSGYGNRLFDFNNAGINQIENVINLLSEKPASRRAVIQLFDASDLTSNYKSIPCTCTLQFINRNNKLNMFVNMRSNDAYLGLPHDIFTFTMIQEIMACSLGIEIGFYQHNVGSLHLYKKHHSKARSYLNEGWMNHKPMMPMPVTNLAESIKELKDIAEKIRNQSEVDVESTALHNYWKDICRLLLAYHFYKKNDYSSCANQLNYLNDRSYNVFIEDRLAKIQNRV